MKWFAGMLVLAAVAMWVVGVGVDANRWTSTVLSWLTEEPLHLLLALPAFIVITTVLNLQLREVLRFRLVSVDALANVLESLNLAYPDTKMR